MDFMGGACFYALERIKLRKTIMRWLLYVVGMFLLAAGLTLNTKTGLGVSAIVGVPYAISEIWNLNFGNVTFVVYILFVAVQAGLHIRMGVGSRARLSGILLRDILQLPVSLLFTRVMNLISAWVPLLREAYPERFFGSFCGRILVLLFAVILTGVGAAMTLNMRLVPNPGDGIVQVLAERFGKPVGTMKNWFDVSCVILTLLLGLLFVGSIVGVGLGTLAAALGVGRVIHSFEHFCKAGMRELAGLNEEWEGER